MAHSLIIGTTGSGKTEFAKQLAYQYHRNGVPVLVLTPLQEDWPMARLLTDDSRKFMNAAEKSRGCALFVDESGEMVGQHEKEMFALATRMRHNNHASHFLAQRSNQLSPTVRNNCGAIFLFTVTPKDAKQLSEDFCDEALNQAPSLPQFHMVYKLRFQPAQVVNLDWRSRNKVIPITRGIAS